MFWSLRNAFVRSPQCRVHLLLFFLLLSIIQAGPMAWGATYTVTNTNNNGAGSLRQGIISANTNPGPDTITFSLPGCDPVCTINLLEPLPLYGGNTTIDGYTQNGSSRPTANTPAVPKIEINGSAIANNNCLDINSPGNLIRGLAINRCTANGIYISGTGATGNRISGNLIGTNYNGFSDGPNTFAGVFIGSGAYGNIIGGTEASERNLISGNLRSGIEISGAGTNNNVVSGNYIGTFPGGNTALPNIQNGIRIYNGAQYNTIGGDTEGQRNLISGNGNAGILIDGAGTSSNTISGNLIGPTADGTAGLGNQDTGIYLGNGTHHNLIGGVIPEARNVISGNGDNGIHLNAAHYNFISGNFIGTDPGGLNHLGSFNGIYLTDAHHNVIGGETPGSGNLLSGNLGGINLARSDANTIQGNTIGLAVDGVTALPNIVGINMISSSNNVIGGNIQVQKNVISGNTDEGIYIGGSLAIPAQNNVVSGNFLGTDATGRNRAGNDLGISLFSYANNTVIGGDLPGSGNVISGNRHGIWMNGPAGNVTGSIIKGNFIGTDSLGQNPIGNLENGVHFSSNTRVNYLGPDNVIAFNGGDGVAVDTLTSQSNFITRNRIFANGGLGINLTNDANGNLPAPTIQSTSILGSIRIAVSACAGCAVQVFNSRMPDGEGEFFLGGGTADAAGNYLLEVNSLSFPYLTATASREVGTSEFSPVFTSTAYLLRLPLILR